MEASTSHKSTMSFAVVAEVGQLGLSSALVAVTRQAFSDVPAKSRRSIPPNAGTAFW